MMNIDNIDEINSVDFLRNLTDEQVLNFGAESTIKLLSVLIHEIIHMNDCEINLDDIIKNSKMIALYNVGSSEEDGE